MPQPHQTCPFRSLFGRKLKNRGLVELLSRLQNRTWEIRMVRRIREMLCFQAEPEAPLVDMAFFAGNAPIQEISAIELHSRLRGPHFETASASGFMNACRQ